MLENDFLAVYIDPALGLQAVLDKGSGTNYSVTHSLLEYDSLVNGTRPPARLVPPRGARPRAIRATPHVCVRGGKDSPPLPSLSRRSVPNCSVLI